MAQMSAEERNPELMESALTLYTEVTPADMRGWLDLAAVRVAMRRNDAALVAVQQAVRVGKEAAVTVLREDARFNAVRQTPEFQTLIPPPPQLPLEVVLKTSALYLEALKRISGRTLV